MNRIAALVLLVASCSHDAGPPAAPRSSPADELEAKMVDVGRAVGRLQRAIIAADDECPAIAAAFRQFASTESAVVVDVAAGLERLTSDEQDQFRKRHVNDADRMQEVYDQATTRCPGDADLGAAIDLAHLRPPATADPD